MIDLQFSSDQQAWTRFIQALPGPTPFLHSWEWGEFQKAYGRDIWRMTITDASELVGVALLVRFPLPAQRGYFFSPRGPLFHKQYTKQEEAYTAFCAHPTFRRLQKETRAVFWRFEPSTQPASINGGSVTRVDDVEPSATLSLSLEQSEEDILQKMKQKTRYNIRLAHRRGVSVEFVHHKDPEQWKPYAEEWWRLLGATSERHGIRSHSQTYYNTLLSVLGAADMIDIGIARYEDKILAMAFFVRYGNTMTYLYGASSEEHKNIMAPYALQWAAIQRARTLGFLWYDFYGISKDGSGSLAGVTQFKMGFGGEVVEYPGTYEFPFSPFWYSMYRTVKRLRH